MKADDEMLEEHNFSDGVRGQLFTSYQQGANVVLLEEAVAKASPDAKSVNKALRLVTALTKVPARR